MRIDVKWDPDTREYDVGGLRRSPVVMLKDVDFGVDDEGRLFARGEDASETDAHIATIMALGDPAAVVVGTLDGQPYALDDFGGFHVGHAVVVICDTCELDTVEGPTFYPTIYVWDVTPQLTPVSVS